MREADIEKKLVKEVGKIGGKALKLNSSIRGLPDRLVLLPGGKLTFIELKAPGGKPRPLQEKRIADLRELGFHVEVINSVAGIDQYIKGVST